MNKLLLATGNSHKIAEIKSVLEPVKNLKIFSLKDFGITIDVTEDGKTLEENSFIKAKKIYSLLKIPALSDDTGLFVDELEGEPGVFSSRYSGDNATYKDNCLKLLAALKNIPAEKRTARFESVICFYVNEQEHYFFKGICNGKIKNEFKGENGFGYDPLFLPEGFNKTFAELKDDEKNKISHRGIALEKFKEFSDSYFR